MTDTTQPQQAAAAAATLPSTEMAVAAHSQEQEHSQTTAPIFSFNDQPLFDVDDDVPTDFFTSPAWTDDIDPSPALTNAMSFNSESCDPSPLLTDINEVPELSGMPLFDDFNSHALYTSDTLGSPKRSPQNAFNRSKDVGEEDSAFLLLRALSKHSNVGLNEATDFTSQQPPTLTASPSVISSPLPTSIRRPLLHSSSSSSSLSVQDKRSDGSQQSSQRGIKRRTDVSDLLPIDAPIQPRTYKTPSATSRKESLVETSFAVEEAAIAAEKDPLVAKRLSNTLAARRSRHRKAEERQCMLDRIEEEEKEKDFWKQQYLQGQEDLRRAQAELDRARAQGFV